jgi:hypothetical protein
LDGRSDEYAREVRAYSLVASSRYVEGARALRAFSSSLPAGPTWMSEVRSRAERLADMAETDREAAHDLLARWESETKSGLRIKDVP